MKLINAETLEHNLLRKAQNGFVLTETIRQVIAEEEEINVPKSATESQKGKWIHGHKGKSYKYRCSICGRESACIVTGYSRSIMNEDPACDYEFCPRCGSQMEVIY